MIDPKIVDKKHIDLCPQFDENGKFFIASEYKVDIKHSVHHYWNIHHTVNLEHTENLKLDCTNGANHGSCNSGPYTLQNDNQDSTANTTIGSDELNLAGDLANL